MEKKMAKAIILCWVVWVPTLTVGEIFTLPLLAWFGVAVMCLGIVLMLIHLKMKFQRFDRKSGGSKVSHSRVPGISSV